MRIREGDPLEIYTDKDGESSLRSTPSWEDFRTLPDRSARPWEEQGRITV
jgi:bifunctional DNA-binding transcriptional regulator/antitoxin component of YhaV-PrlF toxin-antitoxin module